MNEHDPAAADAAVSQTATREEGPKRPRSARPAAETERRQDGPASHLRRRARVPHLLRPALPTVPAPTRNRRSPSLGPARREDFHFLAVLPPVSRSSRGQQKAGQKRRMDPVPMICAGCGTPFERKGRGSARKTFCEPGCWKRFSVTKEGRQRVAEHRVRLINASLRNYLRHLLQSAWRRGKRTITVEQLLRIWTKQRGRCAVTGRFMTTIAGQGYVETNASIDRIDPSGPYRTKNMRLVCRIVNQMKFRLTDEEWLSWSRDIVAGLTKETTCSTR